MSRLTKENREALTRALLKHRFHKEAEGLIEAWWELGKKVYRDNYPKALLKKMATMPEGAFPTGSRLKARFGTSDVDFQINNCTVGSYNFSALVTKEFFVGTSKIPMLHFLSKHYESYRGVVLKVYPATHALAKESSALQAEATELFDTYERVKNEIHAKLTNVRTVKRLLEEWPEVEPFFVLASIGSENSKHLPGLPIAQLNAALELPV